uniref:DUF834 domain-containing protein n=1 Tax=Oryza meridionalis TaxID=40149 RepID=A0A0E0CRI8_9ORYZ
METAVAGAAPTEEVATMAVAARGLVLLRSGGWRPRQRPRREGQEGESEREEAGETGPQAMLRKREWRRPFP